MNEVILPRPVVDLICRLAGGHHWDKPIPIAHHQEFPSFHHSVTWEVRCRDCGKIRRYKT